MIEVEREQQLVDVVLGLAPSGTIFFVQTSPSAAGRVKRFSFQLPNGSEFENGYEIRPETEPMEPILFRLAVIGVADLLDELVAPGTGQWVLLAMSEESN